MQSRLAHAVNLANANSLSERYEKDIKYPDRCNNPKLRAFSASRGIIANRFVNRLHKSASNRSLTNAQLRLVVWEALGVELFNGVNYTCRHCGKQATTYTAHCEACKCSRKNFKNNADNNNNIEVTHPQRYSQLHVEAKALISEHFNKADGTTVSKHEPYCESYFPTKDGDSEIRTAEDWHGRITNYRGGHNVEERPVDAEARVHASMTQERREGIRADLLVRTPIGTYNQFFLLDFTCSTIHSDSNIQYAFKNVGDGCFDVHQGGVADHAESEKNNLYSKWDHIEGSSDEAPGKGVKHIVPFACDSRGGIGKDAIDFIRKVYGKQLVDGPVRNWPSDRMRSNLRNLFLDKLSCLLAKHRSLDYLFWGIPDAKRGGDGFQPSYSVNKYNNLVRTNKITPSKSKSPNVNKRNGQLNVNIRRSPNAHINGSSSSVVGRSSSGVGSSSSSLSVVPCLASPSLQLNFSNL